MKVAIQRISLTSLGKMGCLLGAVAAFLPSLLCGLLGVGLARLVLQWLESWQDLTISLLGQELARFDLVEFFGLNNFLDFLQVVSAASVPVLLLAILIMALVAGVVLAVIVMLVGLTYNLLARTVGGLVVEMNTVTRQQGTGPNTQP